MFSYGLCIGIISYMVMVIWSRMMPWLRRLLQGQGPFIWCWLMMSQTSSRLCWKCYWYVAKMLSTWTMSPKLMPIWECHDYEKCLCLSHKNVSACVFMHMADNISHHNILFSTRTSKEDCFSGVFVFIFCGWLAQEEWQFCKHILQN